MPTTLSLAIKRLLFTVLAAAVTGILVLLTDQYQTAAWYPVVYYILTIARDYLDKTLPNK